MASRTSGVPYLFTGAAMRKGYDNAAFFYDRLSWLVFGNRLRLAQAAFLHLIPADAKVLIVGGGSGWILDAIDKVHSSGLLITYVDASPKMTAMARAGHRGRNKVDFIAEDIMDVQIAGKYDVVITHFFFDNFTQSVAERIFHKLDEALRQGGLWLYTDFGHGKTRHKVLLKTMYLFFKLLCGVQASKLPGMEDLFAAYKIVGLRSRMQGFITSIAYMNR